MTAKSASDPQTAENRILQNFIKDFRNIPDLRLQDWLTA